MQSGVVHVSGGGGYPPGGGPPGGWGPPPGGPGPGAPPGGGGYGPPGGGGYGPPGGPPPGAPPGYGPPGAPPPGGPPPGYGPPGGAPPGGPPGGGWGPPGGPPPGGPPPGMPGQPPPGYVPPGQPGAPPPGSPGLPPGYVPPGVPPGGMPGQPPPGYGPPGGPPPGYGPPGGGGPGGGYAPPGYGPPGAGPGGGYGPPGGPPGYGGPPGGGYPGGFVPPGGAPPGGGPGGQWSPTDALGFAWNAIMKNFAGVSLPIAAAAVALVLPTYGSMFVLSLMSRVVADFVDPDFIGLFFTLANSMIGLLGLLIGAYLAGGVVEFSLKVARGQPVSFGDVFSGGKYFGSILVGQLGFLICAAIGAVLCVVPGYIVQFGLWPFMFVIVDQKLGGIDALKKAWAMTNGHKVSIFLFWLLSIVVMIAGELACLVGVLLVSLPMLTIATAHMYLTLKGEPPRLPQS